MSDIKIPDSCEDCIAYWICGDTESDNKADCEHFHKALIEKYQERPTITVKDGLFIAKGNRDGKARME